MTNLTMLRSLSSCHGSVLFVLCFQLRVRDLDGALDVEKSANTEANKAIDRLTKQIRWGNEEKLEQTLKHILS